jgi:hypothetical protein
LSVDGYASEIGDDFEDPRKNPGRKFKGNQDLSIKRAQWVAQKVADTRAVKAVPRGLGVPPRASPGSNDPRHRIAIVKIDLNQATKLLADQGIQAVWTNLPQPSPL